MPKLQENYYLREKVLFHKRMFGNILRSWHVPNHVFRVHTNLSSWLSPSFWNHFKLSEEKKKMEWQIKLEVDGLLSV